MKLSETGDRKRRERKEREEERSVNPSVHRSSNSSLLKVATCCRPRE